MPGWLCSSCGGTNPVGTRFCGHCGTPQTPAQPVPDPGVGAAAPGAATARATGLDEERRQVTALFADLSGFSRLATTLDPERLAEVIDPILGELSTIVLRYEGHVEKFAGDALLALFGAPVAHEDDASRAQLAALDMHAAARRWSAEPGLPPGGLPLHIGINSGQVVARTIGSSVRLDYGVLGDAVVLAQRLQAAAPAGETYVGAATRELTGPAFEYAPLEPVKVRGRTDPVPAYRLLASRAHRPAQPSAAPLVGRAGERADAESMLGSGGVLVISGDAGVGKSRLAQALHDAAQARGIRWLTSRCPAHGSAQPYSGYRELAPALRPSGSPVLGLLTGGPTADLPADPELRRSALHAAVLDALRGELAAGPVVLLLEDTHWSDPSSAALTVAVAGLAAAEPLLLVLTTRDTGPTPELATAAGPGLRELHLAPLPASDVAELVTLELGLPPDPELLALLMERSGGNPLFAREIVREMRERDELETGAQTVRVRPDVRAEDVPSSIQGILAARLDLLSAPAATMLKVCAVVGRVVPRDVLDAVLGQLIPVQGGWSPALQELQVRGLLTASVDAPDSVHVQDSTGLAFSHALVQEVAYARLLQRQRRDLHQRVADALVRLRPDTDETVDQLARHLTLAGAGRRAVAALERAGERARQLYANAEAHRLLRRADEVAGELTGDDAMSPAERATLRLARAELADLLGDYDEAQTLYEQVRRDTDALDAWRGEAAVLRKRGRCDEVLALLDQAYQVLQPGPSVRGLLELERGRALVAAGRFGDGAEVLEAALPLLPAGSDEAAHALVQLARAQLGPGDVVAARASAEAARDLFERLGDVRGQTVALRVLGNIYQELGRADDAAAALTAGLEAAGRLGDVEERGACLVNLGLLELSRGRLDDAARWNRSAIVEFERVGHRRGAAIAHANLADTLARGLDLDGALQHCTLAAEAADSVQDHLTSADVQATRASVLLAQGHAHEAGGQAEQAAERFSAVSDLTAAAEALELAARCWDAVGDTRRSAQALARAGALAAADVTTG